MILREYQGGSAENAQAFHGKGMVIRKPGQQPPVGQVLAELCCLQAGALRHFNQGIDVGNIPALFVPRTTKCDQLFREFQRKRTHVALVVDEYGRLAGLVTMEDLLEELFGEIADEKEGRA